MSEESFPTLLNHNHNTIERGEINEKVEEGHRRDTWGRSLEFLMSCLSLSVGLGNLWRFPYVCFKNGGAAFILAYVIILIFVGKPFYFLEMILGQFTSKGSIKALEILPIMKGIGWGQQVATCFIATYYTAIIGLTLQYFVRSFATEIPWNECSDYYNMSCVDSNSNLMFNTSDKVKTSVDLYLNKVVLDAKPDISDGIGSIVWPLVGTLFISWLCVFISIVKGIKTSGKLAYVFAILPYVTLILLLSYACTLNGAIDGLYHLIIPDWKKLQSKEVWFEACTQCFYSLTVGMGCIIMFSGYNKFTHNIYRDVTIITAMDTFTSILSASTIFAILGNLKYNYGGNVTFEEITKKTIELVFMTYPDAISKISTALSSSAWYIPQILAIVFFFMLFVLGVGSSVGLLSNLMTNIKDFFPKAKFWQIAGISCSVGFLFGLIYVTQGGLQIIGVVDFFGGEFLIFTLAILEVIAVIWLYGLQNICWDVEFMLKMKISPYFRICWGVIMPICMTILWGWYVYGFEGNKKGPLFAVIGGWSIFILGFSMIFICIAFLYLTKPLEVKSSFLTYLFTPSRKWGPRKSKTKNEWRAFKELKEKTREKKIIDEGLSWRQQKVYELFGKF